MFRFVFVAFLLLSHFGVSQVDSCSFVFKGQVMDEHDNTSVPFAKLQLKELNLSVLADSNGMFQFPPVCAGTYTFSCFHHIGCEPVKFQRVIQSNLVEQIFIEFHFEEIEEVNVTHTVFKMSSISVEKPTELDRNYASGKTLGDLVKQIPGVSTLNTGSSISKPIVHGMHSNRVLVLNNEIRQEGQQWGSEHAPEIDPFLSTEVSLIKGASAVRYGSDAIAGVIIVAPKPLKYKAGVRGQWMGTAFSNGRQGATSAYLEGGCKRLKHFSWRAQGTYKQSGTLHTPRYFMKNTASKEYNFSLASKYETTRFGVELFYSQFNTDLGIFAGAHIGNLTDLNTAFNAEKPLEEGSFTYAINRPRQHIEHELFKASAHYQLNEKNKLVFIYGRQYNLRQEYDKHFSYNDSIAALNLPAFQLTLMTYSGDVKWEHQWHKNVNGEIGVSFSQQGNSYQGRFFVPNFKRRNVGIYWIETWKLKTFEFEAGIRADRTDLEVYMYENAVLKNYSHQFQRVNASVGGAKVFGHHWVVRLNAGTAWRPPSINELYSNGLHHGAAAIEIGNRNLEVEVSKNVQAGVTYKSAKSVFQLDVYHNAMDGFIYLKPTLPPALTIKGAFPVFKYEQVDARFSGVDFYFNYKLTPQVHLSGKGAIVRAFNSTSNSFLVGIPADRFEPGFTYIHAFKKERNLVANLSVPFVRIQDRVEENSDYVAPPNGYVLVNAQITYSFLVRQQECYISMEINNMLNQSYRDYLNRFRYFSDEVGRSIGVKLKVPFNIQKHEKN
ncbi:MAG: TonB-dependent receptor [Crocinitomicaceae bacterium]|nr:MAG: TonB-dependent receptor [Crocinitomicaceae bacterium]